MKHKNREYRTLLLKRGVRKNDDLLRLSASNQDFEYRRLYIKERELDLHVFFSRKFVADLTASYLLGLAIYYFQFPLVALTILGMSLTVKFISIYYQKMLVKVNNIYVNSLRIVEGAIKKEYGISLS